MTIETAPPQSEFAGLVDRHRSELQVHCYRMLGSLEEAEDQVQETFLRAWRKRESFEGRAPMRAWLYKIATNACLDALERRPRQPLPAEDESVFEVPWLQPYPDELLDEVISRETIELAFMVAIQRLPPRQRAALILRDVLDWSAKDTAELLEASVASANSALQRAREALKRHLPERRSEWAPGADPTAEERALLERYMQASERGDAEALAATLHEEVRFAMPPAPQTWAGREDVVGGWVSGGFGTPEWGDLRCELRHANRQPAVVGYHRRPGESAYTPLAIDLLRFEDGLVVDVTTFYGPKVFAAFGLPDSI